MRRALAAGLLAMFGCGSGQGVRFVDRIEGPVAVVLDEEGRQELVPLADAGSDLAEGVVLVDGVPDPLERARRVRAIGELRARLLRDDGRDLCLDGSRR